jgi:hypothetical protein
MGGMLKALATLSLRDLVAEGFRLPRVWVHGVEVTQTIQYERAAEHLTDPADRGADNSVRLIASKPAWVRVYARSVITETWTGVTGTLLVERRFLGFRWTTVATLSPRPPGSITARRNPGYATERRSIGDTLNFVIPAADFYGNLRLTVRLTDADGTLYDSETTYIDATLRQTLRIRGIFVRYSGPATAAMPPPGSPPVPTVTLAAPTLANLQGTAALSLRAMPVQSVGNFASAGTVNWGQPLDDPRSCPGCCSVNWNSLLTALGAQRTADGNRTDVVYYGLLPAGIPLGVPGCGAGGLGSAVTGDQQTLMHEIGHGYGFAHTPCGAGGTPDPAYPTYEPYAAASIGEYGLDIADGTIYSPASTFDYMSYCGPQWMSLYQHNRLIFHPRLGQEWLDDELVFDRYRKWREYVIWRDLPYPPPNPYRLDEMVFDPVVAISGLVLGPGKVEVRSVARVAAAGAPPGARTTLTARLVGPEGETLATGSVRRLNALGGGGGGCGCGCDGDDHVEPSTYAFEVYVPDVGPGAALMIESSEGETVWERRRPSSPPAVGRLEADTDEEGLLRLRWGDRGKTPRGKPREDTGPYEAWVQWSADDGATWRALATGVVDWSASLDTAGLPDGPVLVRVLVHDGFSTATSEPVRVELPERGPQVAILHPEDGALLRAGSTMRAWASVTDSAGTPLEEAWCRWVLDGREVGQGIDEWLTAPGPGEHRLSLLVRAGGGGEAEETVRFTCLPGPDDEGRHRLG